MAFSQQRGRPTRGRGSDRTPQASDRRIKRVREEGQRSRKPLVFFFGAMVLLAIAGVTIGLWYTQFYSPPRVNAAFINDTRFNQGDVVKRVRMIQAAQGYTASSVSLTDILRVLYNPDLDVSAGPFRLGMVQMELLKQGAAEYGISVTDEEIDDSVRAVFTPTIPEGQIATPDQIEREFKEQYQGYLNFNRISDSDYRRLTEEQMYFFRMRVALGANLPAEKEHVEVSWLRTPLRPDPSLGDPERWQDLTTISERLESEEFEVVAREFNAAFIFADPNGYVGWVPRGAFPKLDVRLFGDEQIEALAIGEVSEPWESSGYLYFMKIANGPEVREVSDDWTGRLKDMTLQRWLEDRFEQGTSEGWLGIKYDSEIYAWAAEQLRQTAQQNRGESRGS